MTTEDQTVQAEADELAMAQALADYDLALREDDFESLAHAQARINALRPPLTVEPSPESAEMDPINNELEKASPLERALLDQAPREFHLTSGLVIKGQVTDIKGLTFTITVQSDDEHYVDWTVLSDSVVAMSLRSHA